MKKLDVVRKTFTLLPNQIEYIREIVQKTGMCESEFIRRLINQHMNSEQEVNDDSK